MQYCISDSWIFTFIQGNNYSQMRGKKSLYLKTIIEKITLWMFTHEHSMISRLKRLRPSVAIKCGSFHSND